MILAAGTLAQASFSTASVGLPALAPAIRSHYRISLSETGLVLAAIGIGMLFTLLPWGLAADRVDERLVIAVGLLGAGLALGAAAWTHGLGALVGA
ncbi:MAG: MFS transporter, partial [Acidobacteriota bacterium]|nr:MFS transporter [Acidobacteriota bacterium]